MLRLENVANPATAATAVVPDRVPLPGFASSATVTVPGNPVAAFPWASRAVTCTAGVSAAPAAPVVGCTVKPSCVAAAAVTVKGLLVAPVGPEAEAVSVYPVPALLMLRFANVATPLAAATVAVPASVPLPGFAPRAMVTLPLNPVAVFPCASCAVIWTVGAIAVPAVALLGCTVNSRVAAVPGVILNASLLPVATPAAAAVSGAPVRASP